MQLESVQSKRPGSVRQVGLAGLGVVGRVQKESVRLFETLVEEGKRAEARRDKAAHPPAPAALKALGDQALAQVQHLQQRVEEGSARVLHWVGLPSQVDIQDLSSRLDELQANVQELVVMKKPPRARNPALADVG